MLGGAIGSQGVSEKWPLVEVLGCGSVGAVVNGTGIMSVPGRVWSRVWVSCGVLSSCIISWAVNYVIGSLLAISDFCSIERILSPDEDLWMVSM